MNITTVNEKLNYLSRLNRRDIYVLLDQNGVIMDTILFPITHINIIGQCFKEFVYNDGQYQYMMKEVLENEKVHECFIEIKMPNETAVTEYQIEAECKKTEKELVIFLYGRSMKKYFKAEKDRILLKKYNDTVFENFAGCISIYNAYTRELLYMSDNYKKLYLEAGINIYEGMKNKDFISSENWNYWDSVFERCLAGEIISNARYYNNILKIYLDYDCQIIVDEDKQAKLLFVGRDVTNQVKLEQELQEANCNLEYRIKSKTEDLQRAYQSLDTFNKLVSHELKSPSKEISIYAQIIKEDNASILREESIEDLDAIIKICNESIALVDTFMEYSKSSCVLLHEEPINLQLLVKAIFNEIHLIHSDQEMSINIGDLPSISGDKILIRQAIWNVIENSVKYSSKNKRLIINVGFFREGNNLTYYFHDNGVGFDEEVSDTLFNMFTRGHSSEEYIGNGIGLATVKTIIERHNGKVKIWGIRNKGCTVFWEFPNSHLVKE